MAEQGPATPPGPLSSASDRLRATVTWLIGSLGVVAVAVIGGISLASLGEVSPTKDPVAFGAALVGAGLAIAAALGALVTAASITARSTIAIGDLTQLPARGWRHRLRCELAEQPVTAAWREQNYSAPGVLVKEYMDAVRAYDRMYLATLDPAKPQPADPVALNRAKHRFEYLQDHVATLMAAASYLRLRAAFRSSLALIAGFVVVVVVGALIFSYAIATLKNDAAPTELTAATWSVPDPIRTIVASRLGDGCRYDLDAVPVMIVEVGDDDTRRIVTQDAADCTRLELSTTADRLVER